MLAFNPFGIVTQIVGVVVFCLLAYLAWRYRHRVMQAFTGDDRIHLSFLDFVWWSCCRCCGVCTGDWTRMFTRCICCPYQIRGANLLTLFGRFFGFTPYTVELKNIVVGDLPWPKRADFYLMVECAANPPMMSSLAEEKHPKVVHFPEVITLRLRWSPLEQQVVITVRELNLLGSTDLCKCRINAMSLLSWSSDPRERMKRFEMKPVDHHYPRETPAWILLEFDQPSEARDLEHLHENINTVRTATGSGRPGFQDLTVANFKHQYELLDAHGHRLQEPPESHLHQLNRLWMCLWSCQSCFSTVVFLALLLYLPFRSYLWTCHKEFKHMTIAYMHNTSFPINRGRLQRLVDECAYKLDGTGAKAGLPCKPSDPQIRELCYPVEAGGKWPPRQPWPEAGSRFVEEATGLRVPGFPCHQITCSVHQSLVEYDVLLFGSCVLLVIMLVCCKMCSHHIVHDYKKRLVKQHSHESQILGTGRRARGLQLDLG